MNTSNASEVGPGPTQPPAAFTPYFGAFILETLTMGMYGESRNAIREYIQNSFDSLRDAIQKGLVTNENARVDITLDPDAEMLVIRDNGVGLHHASAADTLVSIGASRKDYRKSAGFRGIGRLAGIVFCHTLTFETKQAHSALVTKVTFNAQKLRELLQPERAMGMDATATLRECITIDQLSSSDTKEHYFEVRLTGFENPPVECRNIEALRSFVGQVSPLPYSKDFSHNNAIEKEATERGKQIETVRVYLKKKGGEFSEVFKPYGNTYTVKRNSEPLVDIEFLRPPSNKWWGWIGHVKASGAIKDSDAKGIRVRVRNIQIDGTDIMRDLFSQPGKDGTPRTSYARFVDWYVGEIFIDPTAAVPNARRDGFEEDDKWEQLSKELNELVAEKYGRQAYRTSVQEQLSVQKLKAKHAELQASLERLRADGQISHDTISPVYGQASEIQRRITKASVAATDEEGSELFELSKQIGSIKYELNRMTSQASKHLDCSTEITKALSEMTQRLYEAFRDQMPLSNWPQVKEIVERVTGESPA